MISKPLASLGGSWLSPQEIAAIESINIVTSVNFRLRFISMKFTGRDALEQSPSSPRCGIRRVPRNSTEPPSVPGYPRRNTSYACDRCRRDMDHCDPPCEHLEPQAAAADNSSHPCNPSPSRHAIPHWPLDCLHSRVLVLRFCRPHPATGYSAPAYSKTRPIGDFKAQPPDLTNRLKKLVA